MSVPEWEDNEDTKSDRIYACGFEDGRYIERQEMAKRTCGTCKMWVKSNNSPSLMRCAGNNGCEITGDTFFCGNWEDF